MIYIPAPRRRRLIRAVNLAPVFAAALLGAVTFYLAWLALP